MKRHPRSLLQLSILATLIEEPMNAYQVYVIIATTMAMRLPGYSAVHRALSRLYESGYVAPITGQRHNRYQLTPSGRHCLLAERHWLFLLQSELSRL